jgi:hypothetical protein
VIKPIQDTRLGQFEDEVGKCGKVKLSCIRAFMMPWGFREKKKIDSSVKKPDLKVNGMIGCGMGGFVVFLLNPLWHGRSGRSGPKAMIESAQ